jgi:hypothetical protein
MHDLNDRFPSLRAGIRVGTNEGAEGDCTVGPLVMRAGQRGFLIPSHCTSVFGGMDGIGFYQPQVDASHPEWYAGAEYVDRESVRTCPNPSDTSDPAAYSCRDSDASVVALASAASWLYGEIARPSQRVVSSVFAGPTTTHATLPTIYIVNVGDYPNPGVTMDKVGKATGWTAGPVEKSCTGIFYPQGRDASFKKSWVVSCQDWFRATTSGGDSGAPVFYYDPTYDDATLYGMVVAHLTDNSMGILSSIWNIQEDLGAMNYFPF